MFVYFKNYLKLSLSTEYFFSITFPKKTCFDSRNSSANSGEPQSQAETFINDIENIISSSIFFILVPTIDKR